MKKLIMPCLMVLGLTSGISSQNPVVCGSSEHKLQLEALLDRALSNKITLAEALKLVISLDAVDREAKKANVIRELFGMTDEEYHRRLEPFIDDLLSCTGGIAWLNKVFGKNVADLEEEEIEKKIKAFGFPHPATALASLSEDDEEESYFPQK